MALFITAREARNPTKGVAYLDDGTIGVCGWRAGRMINKTIDIIVTSVHQTTAGQR